MHVTHGGCGPMICVTSRFHLRRFWHLVPMYFRYRRMQHDLGIAPGLLRFAFAVEDPLTIFTFSVWESSRALGSFANVHSHVSAVHSAKNLCSEIWSAYWHLDQISNSAQIWSGPFSINETSPESHNVSFQTTLAQERPLGKGRPHDFVCY